MSSSQVPSWAGGTGGLIVCTSVSGGGGPGFGESPSSELDVEMSTTTSRISDLFSVADQVESPESYVSAVQVSLNRMNENLDYNTLDLMSTQ